MPPVRIQRFHYGTWKILRVWSPKPHSDHFSVSPSIKFKYFQIIFSLLHVWTSYPNSFLSSLYPVTKYLVDKGATMQSTLPAIGNRDKIFIVEGFACYMRTKLCVVLLCGHVAGIKQDCQP